MMQIDTGSIIEIILTAWKYLRRNWILTTKEKEILAKAQLHPNELYVLSVDTVPEFIKVGTESLGREDNPHEIAQYVEAFRNLEAMGLVQHVSKRVYRLTARGYQSKSVPS